MIEKMIESVGKARNYGPTTKDLEEERRQVEIRLREKEEARQAESKHKKEEEEQRAQQQKEWVRTHTLHGGLDLFSRDEKNNQDSQQARIELDS